MTFTLLFFLSAALFIASIFADEARWALWIFAAVLYFVTLIFWLASLS